MLSLLIDGSRTYSDKAGFHYFLVSQSFTTILSQIE